MERIILACDFSVSSAAALDAVRSLVRRSDARVTVVHVFDPSVVPDPIARRRWERLVEDELEERRKRIGRADVEAVALERPQPAEAIVAMALERTAALVVVGAHGHSRIEHLVLGSVAEHVARFAPCDVLVVRPTVDGASFPRSILLATDLTEASHGAELRAAEWARTHAARLTVAHVYDESPPLRTTRTAAGHRLEKVLAGLRFSNGGGGAAGPLPPWRTELLVGLDVAGALCRRASELAVDLLVVGSHDRSRVGRLAFGSVAGRVVRKSPTAVLVVRP